MSEKTHAEIIEEMNCGPIPEHRHDREILRYYAHSLDLAHKREADVFEQRVNELDAEIAAKDEVIKRLNDALVEEQKRSGQYGNVAKLPKTGDLRFDICSNIALVLKIGRDFQNKDGYRGAHYDTVKLLCDAIEYQQEQLKTKTEVGDCAKLREALTKVKEWMERRIATCGFEFSATFPTMLEDVVLPALATPPRNCNKYDTPEKAFEAHLRYCRAHPGCRGCKWSESPCCDYNWLYAGANESEVSE